MKKIRTTFLILVFFTSVFVSSMIYVTLSAHAVKTKAPPPSPPGKNKPPRVTITFPADGSTVSGIITITVEANDKEDGPLVPDIYIDDIPVAHANSYEWDTTDYADGSHPIKAEATDTGGKTGSDVNSVTVNNGSPPPPGDHYALIVGISDYDEVNDLDYCDEDATDWYNHFVSLNYDHIIVLGDGHPSNYPKYDGLATRARILEELDNLAAGKSSTDIIAFSFSGHGCASSRTDQYICPWDSDPYSYDRDIQDYEVAQKLSTTSAGRIFVFLDSCNSGGFIPEFKAYNPIGTMYVTTTCGAKGYGYDVPEYQNGAWTYWFLEAGLVGQGFTEMEPTFDYAYANYPYKGKNDRPLEWDEDGANPFCL